MKKFIFLLLFTLSTLFTKAQVEFNFSPMNYNQFMLSEQAYCGKGSLYCIITRSQTVNGYGYYCYQIYFATNSYFANCNPARTYVPNIEVMYLEGKYWYYPANFQKFWVTCGSTVLVYTLYHPYSNLNIKIRTGQVEPTIY